MKKLTKDILRFARKPVVLVAVVLLIILVSVATGAFSGDPLSGYDTEVVERGNIVQRVTATGRVEPSEELELSIETGGIVSFVGAEAGDRVNAGEVLASTKAGRLIAQRSEIASSLKRVELELSALSDSSSLSPAGSTIEVARAALKNEIREGYFELENTLRTNIDLLFSNPQTNPNFGDRDLFSGSPTVYIAGTSRENIEINRARKELNSKLSDWLVLLNGGLENDDQLEAASIVGRQTLVSAQRLLSLIGSVVSDLVVSGSSESSTVNSIKSGVSIARTSVNNSLSNLISLEQEFRDAKRGVGSFEIELAELAVKKEKAKLQSIDAQLAEKTIRSPINGVVTVQNAELGEFINSQEPVITVVSDSQYEIESFVSEADIAKVSVGDEADVYLDSYGPSKIFKTVIVLIDPAETFIEGVATYRTKLNFVEASDLPRPGMTANIIVKTGTRENVILIPQRAVKEINGINFVTLVEGEETKEREVELGLRGSKGNVEVISGLSEGEVVVISKN